MTIGSLNIVLSLTGCESLKTKRSMIQPVIHRIHREYNVSISEMDFLDSHNKSLLSCSMIANERTIIERSFTQILNFIEHHFPEQQIVNFTTEYY
jgi:uncharacterized protein